MELTADVKEFIDGLTHYQLLEKIRFGNVGDKYVQGSVGEYWLATYRRKRDENPQQAIIDSKRLGWIKANAREVRDGSQKKVV